MLAHSPTSRHLQDALWLAVARPTAVFFRCYLITTSSSDPTNTTAQCVCFNIPSAGNSADILQFLQNEKDDFDDSDVSVLQFLVQTNLSRYNGKRVRSTVSRCKVWFWSMPSGTCFLWSVGQVVVVWAGHG